MGVHEIRATPAIGAALGPAQRPTNFVAAVIHDITDFERAIEEIVAMGIPRESLGLLFGKRGADAIAHRERHWWTDLLSDEVAYVDRYLEEIQSGGYVIGIPLPAGRANSREAVRAILRSHGARYIVSSSRWAHMVED